MLLGNDQLYTLFRPLTTCAVPAGFVFVALLFQVWYLTAIRTLVQRDGGIRVPNVILQEMPICVPTLDTNCVTSPAQRNQFDRGYEDV